VDVKITQKDVDAFVNRKWRLEAQIKE